MTTPRSTRALAVLGGLLACLALACGESGGEMKITGLAPQKGGIQGEQPIRITGQNFRTDIGYTVYFGTKKSSKVGIMDPSTIVAVLPAADAAGTVDVTIRADNGPAFKLPGAFSYEEVAAPGAAGQKGNLAF